MIADGEYVPDLKNISDGQLFALIAAKDDLAHAAYRVLYEICTINLVLMLRRWQ